MHLGNVDFMYFLTNDSNLVARWKEAAGTAKHQCLESLDALQNIDAAKKNELVIFDLTIPGLADLTTAMKFCRENPDTPIIFMAEVPDESEGLQLVSVGARGYCNRYIDPALLEKAIEVVRLGEVWLGRKLITRLMDNLAALTQQTGQNQNAQQLKQLTDREKEIAMLIGAGETNKKIAQELNISERTVKAHLGSIFIKTETKDRLQLGLLVNICRH